MFMFSAVFFSGYLPLWQRSPFREGRIICKMGEKTFREGMRKAFLVEYSASKKIDVFKNNSTSKYLRVLFLGPKMRIPVN